MIEARSSARFWALAWSFAQRELKSRFKDTALGWLWSLAIPLGTLAVYSIVFGLIFKAGAPNFGTNREPIYAVWLFCGMVAFQFFANGVLRGIDALVASTVLMRKVPVPPAAPVAGSLIAGAFQTLLEIALVLALLLFLGNVGASWFLVPLWAALFFVFTAGVAMVLAIATAHLRDVAQIAAVLMQFLFFATPVVYPIELVPDGALGGWLLRVLEGNPIAHFVEMFRDLTYELHTASVGDWLYLAFAAAAALALGAFVTSRHGRDLAEKL